MKNQLELNFYNFKIKNLTLKYAYKNLLQKPLIFISIHFALFIFVYLYHRIPSIVPENFAAFCQMSFFFLICVIYFSVILNLGACKNIKEYLLTFTKIGLVDHLCLPPYPLYHKNNKEGTQELELYAPGFLLSDFEKFREQIETALNINVLLVQQKKDKKDIFIITFCNSKSLSTNIYYNKDTHFSYNDTIIRLGETQQGFAEIDFNRTPHGIICGSTGGGKSVLSKVILTQAKEKGAEVYVVDPKMSDDFTDFNPLYTLEQALNLTEALLFEISSRQQTTDKDYNRIIVLIDEASFLMDTTGLNKEEKEQANRLIRNLTNIARIGRAFKVNLIFTTQRSDSTHSLPGNLKCNCSLRISSHLPDRASSEVIMGDSSAYNLPHIPGRFVMNDGQKTIIFQAFNIK